MITDIAESYILLHRLGRGAAYLIRRTADLYGDRDLTDAAASGWLASLEGRYSPWTVAGHRTRLLALWRLASRLRGIPAPGVVRREPAPEPMPAAWTLDEVRRLIAACDQIEGGGWFRAVILAAYETGLRRGDLVALKRSDIAQDGTIRIRQGKTSRVHVVRLRPSTAALVLALTGDRPLRIPWGTRKYTRLWAELRRIAGVGPGGLQRLRRTGASYVAQQEGLDAAREFLGHSSPEMVRHYVDQRIATPRCHLPPRVA